MTQLLIPRCFCGKQPDEEDNGMPEWLKDTVFYEIYPQSFKDSNGDGIGDINGIREKLDYIRGLGCSALWINPCFDSPFKDAGYDVRDYKKVAPRYGTNEDLFRLFREAHDRNMHVLLDLVPGHTSEEHEWFRMSRKNEKNQYSDRYIWTDFCFHGAQGYPYIGGESERSATYLLNFFKCQPALNYGWLHPTAAWQQPVDSPAAIGTREAMKDVCRFWMDHGCDGFRVDMANSLVKGDDEKKTGTSAIWRDVRNMLDRDYPQAALVSEWNDPSHALRAGFHMDFCLNESENKYDTLVRDYQNHTDTYALGMDRFSGRKAEKKEEPLEDHSFFRKDAGGSITEFLSWYRPVYEDTKDLGYISLITCNHDTVRPRYNMEPEELKLFYAFLFTMPGVPFLYYGDEIGMRYQNLPTKEGGYFRTGARTPMQWSKGRNAGFSEGEQDSLYLPVDPAEDAPTVEENEKDPGSLLNTVKEILRLRHSIEDLQADAEFEPVFEEKGSPAFVYRRGGCYLALNTSSRKLTVPVDAGKRTVIFKTGEGISVHDKELDIGAQTFAILKE
jgi:alpha-glucosidase